MTASLIGLLIELLLFGAGVYLYLFARGALSYSDPKRQAEAERVRKENGRWMRIGGLALAAIMAVNVVLHLTELFG